ncbi:MAG: four helix bundle protein [Pyrinomonadaceae bacterium]|nr:four helix bundle protein [Pyrinomonadaceae bacterium]
MATIRRFEDIGAWQKARKLTFSVYKLTREGEFSRDFGLRDQIRRASVSIMANIAEGFARKSDRDFAHFLTISRSSAAEVQSHLYIANDLDYISKQDFQLLYDELEQLSKMIFSLTNHLRKSIEKR